MSQSPAIASFIWAKGFGAWGRESGRRRSPIGQGSRLQPLPQPLLTPYLGR
jgi:hypothetical protein